MNRPAAGVDQVAAAAAEAADRRQAEYYLRVLSQECLQIHRRIAKYQAATARYESRGGVDDARRCRRMIRKEEHDRDRLEGMIAALHLRFRPPGVLAPQGLGGLPAARISRHQRRSDPVGDVYYPAAAIAAVVKPPPVPTSVAQVEPRSAPAGIPQAGG